MNHSRTYYRVRTVTRVIFWTAVALAPFIVTGLLWPGSLN
jgi:hypothetical protein